MMKFSPYITSVVMLICLFLPACSMHKEEHHSESHKILVTRPEAKDVTITQEYVCLIHSQRHIKVRALARGYLEAIPIKEGQTVKTGETMFKVIPVLYQAKLDAALADNKLVQLEYEYAKKLFEEKVISKNEVALKQATVKRSQAYVVQAMAVLTFSAIRAPFDGIVDRLGRQQGSLVEEGDELTTLSDNGTMWVYFNVPEARYLQYMTDLDQRQEPRIELVLANGEKFQHAGKIGAIEADFNNETGNIPFRADFPNPDRLLRNGQTGNVLISKVMEGAIVIPQRATFEVQNQRFVYVIDKDDVAHQREISVEHELEDIFLIKNGLGLEDKIVLEGIRQVHDGDKVEYEDQTPEQVAAHLKYHAE